MKSILVPIFCCLFAVSAAAPPPSPCPEVFEYDREFEPDRWYGIISFRSNVELYGFNIKLILNKPSQLLAAWDADPRTKDNKIFFIFNPFVVHKAGKTLRTRIMVKFDPNSEPPVIENILIDDTAICYKGRTLVGPRGPIGPDKLSTSTTERYDPDFTSKVDIVVDEYVNRDNTIVGSGNQDQDTIEDRNDNRGIIRPTVSTVHSTRQQGNTVIHETRTTSTSSINTLATTSGQSGNNHIPVSTSNSPPLHHAVTSPQQQPMPPNPIVSSLVFSEQNSNLEELLHSIRSQLAQKGTVSSNTTYIIAILNPPPQGQPPAITLSSSVTSHPRTNTVATTIATSAKSISSKKPSSKNRHPTSTPCTENQLRPILHGILTIATFFPIFSDFLHVCQLNS